MSAPETNIERQKRRHWPALAGIAGGFVLLALILFITSLWRGAPLGDQASPREGAVPQASSES